MLLHLWGQSTNHPGTDDIITELEKIPSHVTAMGFGWGCRELLFLLDKPVYMLEGRWDFPMQLETQVLKVSHATLPKLEDQHHPNTSDKGIVREHVWTSTCLEHSCKVLHKFNFSIWTHIWWWLKKTTLPVTLYKNIMGCFHIKVLPRCSFIRKDNVVSDTNLI